jgi:hypothetical protein
MIQNLMSGTSNKEKNAINQYSDALITEFSDIYDAHRIANTFASDDTRTKIDEETESPDRKVGTLLGRPYSIVPLKFGYVKNPLNTIDKEFDENSLSIDEFIGFGRSKINYKHTGSTRFETNDLDPLRPIDLNPFTAIDGIASDALYRTFLAPTYNIVKKMMGDVERNKKDQLVTSNGFLFGVVSKRGDNKNAEKYPLISAYIMNTIEKTIRNDMPNNAPDSLFEDTLKFATVYNLAKTLVSVWQPIVNGVLPMMSKFAQHIAIRTLRKTDEARVSFLNKMGRNANSLNFSEEKTKALVDAYYYALKGYFRSNGESGSFVKENSINSYKWRADGANVRQTQISLTRYHKENRLKYGARWLAAKINKAGEKGLDITIGAPERANVQAIYTFELLNELQKEMGPNAPKTIREMFAMNPEDISTLAKTKADILVADFMGMSDKSKKAGMFNVKSKSSLIRQTTNFITRYGNHKMTTNANMQVYGKYLFQSMMKGGYSGDMTGDAVKNIVGTLTQNILYHYAKAGMSVSAAIWITAAFAEMFDEDEEDEDFFDATNERYFKWLRAVTQPEEGEFLMNVIKDQVFPKMTTYTNVADNKTPIGEALTDRVNQAHSDAVWEFLGFTPQVGAIMGLSPLESLIKITMRESGGLIDRGREKYIDIAGLDEKWGWGDTPKEQAQQDYDRSQATVRDAKKVSEGTIGPLIQSYKAIDNVSSAILNRFAPKDGYEKISNEEFIYALANQFMLTREGFSNQPKRHQKIGGWGPVNN